MSAAVTCFMLVMEPCHVVQVGYTTELRIPCKAHHHGTHRVTMDVPSGFTLDDAYTGGPVACGCGEFEFTSENSRPWLSTSYTRFTNPRTGKSSTNVYEVATPGAMWYCPWLVPDDVDLHEKPSSVLSSHYIRDWWGKRPPICVKLPNGKDWIVDQKATNGEGWTVTGEAPMLTAVPSIQAADYHSWLTNGVLGADPSCTAP